jgi:hypothetical protein
MLRALIALVCAMPLTSWVALAQQSRPASPTSRPGTAAGESNPTKVPAGAADPTPKPGSPGAVTPSPSRIPVMPWMIRPELPPGTASPRATARPAPSKTEPPEGLKRLPFDYRQAQLRKVDNNWTITLGTQTLKDFGRNEREARQALRAIQFYRFNEYQVLGEGDYQFEFFLVNSQAPRGRLLNQVSQPIYPDTLAARLLDGGWWITQAEQPLLRLGSKEHANRAIDLIRRYRFDQINYIGQPDPLMTYFTRTR